MQSCVHTVACFARDQPDRFAVFGYAHIPAVFKKHQRMILNETAFADADADKAPRPNHHRGARLGGYRRIGLDHFALSGDDLDRGSRNRTLRRNFQGYTTDTASV